MGMVWSRMAVQIWQQLITSRLSGSAAFNLPNSAPLYNGFPSSTIVFMINQRTAFHDFDLANNSI